MMLPLKCRLRANCYIFVKSQNCSFAALKISILLQSDFSLYISMETKRILIVDDEETLCEVLKLNLENEGFDADYALSAEQALTYDLCRYDLILLDIMMGEMSGIKMAKRLKADVRTAQIPIIFCTARDSEDDMVMGLNLGADDYIAKPYTIRNVVARVKSVLRRTSATLGRVAKEAEGCGQLIVEGLCLDLEFKRCTVDGTEVKLAKKEFELLAYLIRHRGKICSREQILSRVWTDEVIVLDRTIDVNITRLRSKIGTYGAYIITRSGFGYGFRD